MTTSEENILAMLAEVWNKFLKLPTEHPMEHQEFCSAIHVCQNMVLSRETRRDLSEAELRWACYGRGY
jgi:hypothetical protein